jgi:hypothetical protein
MKVCYRHGLKDAGDGVQRGTVLNNEHTLGVYAPGPVIELENLEWSWSVGGVNKEQDKSRYLNRLDVQKELFNVFINRAVGLWLHSVEYIADIRNNLT